MRVIKFRGKCIESGQWIYGDLIHGVGHKEGNVYILPRQKNLAYIKHCDPLDGVRVDPKTIGQFTGLKDKNGKEIYEGDIVKSEIHKPKNYLVEFIEGGFCCTHPNISPYPIDINHFYPSIGCQIEVIGNIHENPNLLEL